MKTFVLRKEDVQRRWLEIDAADQVLGRMAAQVARILMGKDKPTYTPGGDTGDFVIIINAKSVKVTGNKEEKKLYRRYTGYIGGLVEEPLSALRAKKPEKVILLAVKRMLPKNALGVQMLRRLKVYPGSEHPHGAQQPQRLDLGKKGT